MYGSHVRSYIIIKIKVIEIKIGINVSKILKETYKSTDFSARLNPSEPRSFFLINSVVRLSESFTADADSALSVPRLGSALVGFSFFVFN